MLWSSPLTFYQDAKTIVVAVLLERERQVLVGLSVAVVVDAFEHLHGVVPRVAAQRR